MSILLSIEVIQLLVDCQPFFVLIRKKSGDSTY